jgi:methylthioribose-1-phosphate isomerase
MLKSVEWRDGIVRILDQTKLPGETRYIDCEKVFEVAEAIRGLLVRGAPAIGIAAAYGIALAAYHSTAASPQEFRRDMEDATRRMAATRPTAVNLFSALNRIKKTIQALNGQSIELQKKALLSEAHLLLNEDIEANRTIGCFGATLIENDCGILTYCNTGALATGGYGTALGVIRSVWEAGRKIMVFVCETRPVLQGARLTAWELQQEGIPQVLITDNMAGRMMRLGKIQYCIVGADRIAANGDVANKIGTYTMAVLAKEHQIPFYVAATTSTIDFSISNGDEIPIEERDPEEVVKMGGRRYAPEGVTVLNPAFDITPAIMIRAIITEKGVFTPDQIKTLLDH